MNQKTTYELIITEKLQHLPLPGLEDAIWARVKNQLDVDMPGSDDDGGTPPDAPSGSGWIWSAGLFAVVVALVTVFFLTKKQPENRLPSSVNNSQTAQPATTAKQPPYKPPPASEFSAGSSPPAVSAGDLPVLTNRPLLPVSDSLLNQSAVTFSPLDTLSQTALILPPPTLSTDTVPAKKKRGVTGLTDADYRIVPKKDNE